MSIELAEQLKQELTDKYVVISNMVPELKRFVNLTGQVKTVNMSGRALVQFNGPEDIGLYDIAPEYLTVVDAPQPKKKPAAKSPEKKSAAKAAPAKPAAGGKKLSPLELARQQGAAGAAPAAKPAAAKPDAPAGKKLSP